MQPRQDPMSVAEGIISRNKEFYDKWHHVLGEGRASSPAAGRFSEENVIEALTSYFPRGALCTGIIYRDSQCTGQVDIIVLKPDSRPPIRMGAFALADASDVVMAVEVKNYANGIHGIQKDIDQVVTTIKPVLAPLLPWIVWIGMPGGQERARTAIDRCRSAGIAGAIVALFRNYEPIEFNPGASFGRFLDEVERLTEKYWPA